VIKWKLTTSPHYSATEHLNNPGLQYVGYILLWGRSMSRKLAANISPFILSKRIPLSVDVYMKSH
jgi:hypothetical protein